VSTTTAQPRPRRGDELEVTVDSLAYGGAGVARHEGFVLFVAGGLPGDRVRAVVGKAKRSWAEARAVEVLEPSPERIAPVADHPGAPWQVLPYARQLEVKSAQVDEALRRIGHLDAFTLEPIVPALEQWRYRNKVELSFGSGPDGTLVCGFHAPGRWEEIVAVEDCLLISARANAALARVVTWCRGQGLPAYDRRTNEGRLRNLVVREGRRTGQLQLRLVVSPGDVDSDGLADAAEVDSVLITRHAGLGETTQRGETELVRGVEHLEEELGDLSLAISPHAFFQTNTEMAEVLYGVAAELADLRGHERLYDLFCGIGTVGLTLAPRAGELFGLELVPEAVADAIFNAQRNGVDRARFYAGDVRVAMRDLVAEAGKPDVVVVDPPRSGLSQKVVRRIAEAAPRRIVYISCNPTTLAPNAAQLTELGYVLGRVRPVDMFPQTPHIECVAVLDRA
jgi:23S rRNA (uracil1939-C5)-methyltransferase